MVLDAQSGQKTTSDHPVHARLPEGNGQEPFGNVTRMIEQLRFDGPSLTLLPDDTMLCGATASMAALRKSRRGVARAVRAGGGGLILVSVREQLAAFAAQLSNAR